MRVLLRLLSWACDPDKVEVLQGDVLELHAQGRAVLGHALSACVLHSRLTTAAARRRVLRWGALGAAAVIALLGADPDRGALPTRYVISAADPGGRFTLEIERARVVRATLDDVPVDPARLVQAGSTLVIKGGDRGRDFAVALQPSGGIRWEARTP